jgi:hypothetical protein
MICKQCGQKIEYDEGIGNSEDGYICFECDDENKINQTDAQIGSQYWEGKL